MTSTFGKILKRTGLTLAGGFAGLFVLAVSPAAAATGPTFCKFDHDHRSHAANYYDYYKKDRFFRAGPYRSNISIAFTTGNRGNYYGKDVRYKRSGYYDNSRRRNRFDRRNNRGHNSNRGYSNRGHKGHHNDNRKGHKNKHNKRTHHNTGSKLIKRDIYHTRFDAKVILKEELFYDAYGKKLICSVKATGYEAKYVPFKRLKRLANRNCSYGAKIKIN